MSDLIIGLNLSASVEKNFLESLPSTLVYESRGLSAKINFAERKFDLLQAIILQGQLDNFIAILRELKANWRLRHTDIVWIGESTKFQDYCLADYLGVRLQFKKEPNQEEILILTQRWLQDSKQKHHVTRLEQLFVQNLNTKHPTDPFSDEALQKLSALNPWYQRYKILYAQRLLEKQEWEKANHLLMDLVKQYPYFLDAQVLYAQSLLKTKKEKLASEILIKIESECQSIFTMQSEDLKRFAGFKEQSPLSELANEVEQAIEKIKSELFYEIFSESILKRPQDFPTDSRVSSRVDRTPKNSGQFTKHSGLTTYQSSPLLSFISLNNLLSGQTVDAQLLSPRYLFTSMDHLRSGSEKEFLLIGDDFEFLQEYVENLGLKSSFDVSDIMEASDKLRLHSYKITFLFFKKSLEEYRSALENLLLMNDVTLLPTCVLHSKDSDVELLHKILAKDYFFEGFYPLPDSKEELFKIKSSCVESFEYQGGFKKQIEICRELAFAAKMNLKSPIRLEEKLKEVWNSSLSEEKKIILLVDSTRIFSNFNLGNAWMEVLEGQLKSSEEKNYFLKKLAWVAMKERQDSLFPGQRLLLEQLSSESYFSYEKIYAVANVFLGDANPSGLHKLLEYWIHNDRLPKNLCFELVFMAYLLEQTFSNSFELVVIESSLERYPTCFELNMFLLLSYQKAHHYKIADAILERLAENVQNNLHRMKLLSVLKSKNALNSSLQKVKTKLLEDLSFQ